MTSQDKLLAMLQSADPEMIQLAVITILNAWTSEECLKRLPAYGYEQDFMIKKYPDRFESRVPPMKTGSLCDYMWIKNGIAIALLHGYVQCRPVYRFKKRTLDSTNKLYLDEKKE